MVAAIRVHEHGGPEVLKYEDVPDPVAGPGQVLEDAATTLAHVSLIPRWRPAAAPRSGRRSRPGSAAPPFSPPASTQFWIVANGTNTR